MQAAFSVTGLVLDIFGVIVLFKYGLPPSDVELFEYDVILANELKPEDKKKQRKYRRMSKVGLILLIIGFGLQATSSIIQTLPIDSCGKSNCCTSKHSN